jgi:hypothetical protein
MTAHEALWLIKVQLQKNDQNLEAIKVLEDIVKSVYRVHIDDYGTEAQHMKNHMEKVAKQDIHELHEREKYHGEWVIEEGVLVYKEVLDADE